MYKTGKSKIGRAVVCLLLVLLTLCGCAGGKNATRTEQTQGHSFGVSLREPSDPSFTPAKTPSAPSPSPSYPSPANSSPSPSSPSPVESPSDDGPLLEVKGEGGTVAVWWWDKSKAYPGNREKYLSFLEQNHVNEIYLCWPDFNGNRLASFVKAAGERGIGVSLLSGDASWIDPQNSGADEVVDAFLSYQQSAEQDERLRSLHMDVEPHQLSAFFTDEQGRILQEYADFVVKTAEKVRKEGELIAWDIPFWFDDYTVQGESGQQIPLLELLAQNADTLCLMSYRDSAGAVLECSEKELTLGEKYGCQVICGLETYSAEGDHVSFMEEGKAYMYKECAALYDALCTRLERGKFGIAVHYLDTWYKLQD